MSKHPSTKPREAEAAGVGTLRLWIIYLGGALAWLALVSLEVGFHEKVNGTHLGHLMSGAADGMLAFLLASFLFDFVLKKNVIEEWSEAIKRTLNSYPQGLANILASLDPVVRQGLILDELKGLLMRKVGIAGDDANQRAEAVFRAGVEPYLSGMQKFRENADYRVMVEPISLHGLEGPQEFRELLAREKDLYNWVDARYQYAQRGGVHSSRGRIEVCFVFDTLTLGNLLGDGNVFVRELFQIEDGLRNYLMNANEATLAEVFAQTFAVRFEVDGKTVEEDFKMEKEAPKGKGKPVLRVSIAHRDEYLAKAVAIVFRLPQSAKKKSFVFSIPEPTNGLDMNFELRDDSMLLDHHPFYPVRNVTFSDIRVNSFKVKLRDWVFPRAGVVFTWEERHHRNAQGQRHS